MRFKVFTSDKNYKHLIAVIGSRINHGAFQLPPGEVSRGCDGISLSHVCYIFELFRHNYT